MSEWLQNQPNCNSIVNEAVSQLVLPLTSRYNCSITTTPSTPGIVFCLLDRATMVAGLIFYRCTFLVGRLIS